MSTAPTTRRVGVDLQDSEDTHALVEAIEADNPDVEVAHMPGLIRVTKAWRARDPPGQRDRAAGP